MDAPACVACACARSILELLAAGNGRAEILADFPYLEDDDISAALEYAARQADHPVIRVA